MKQIVRPAKGGALAFDAMKVEIREKLELTPTQRKKILFHSVDNVLNVLVGNFRLIGKFVGDETLFAAQIEQLTAVAAHIAEPDLLVADLRWLGARHQTLRDALAAAAPAIAAAPEDKRHLAERCALAIGTVLDVVLVRAAELVARHTHGDAWRPHPVSLLRHNIRQVMDAIANNSLGRYRVAYREEDGAPDAYVLLLDFVARDGDVISMPEVLQDCIRDLVCNARKYSPPGTTIRASLVEGDGELCVSVSDQGVGIAADEIDRVVHFGVRGSGSAFAPTMGGGYALTKVWFVVEGLGGRMWIDSEPGVGTTISFRVPAPDTKQPSERIAPRAAALDGALR